MRRNSRPKGRLRECVSAAGIHLRQGKVRAYRCRHRLVILVQSFIAGILGYFAGVGLGFVAAQIAEYFVPGFITEIVLSDLVSIFGAALLMSFIAVWLPVQRIARIDPASVFKA